MNQFKFRTASGIYTLTLKDSGRREDGHAVVSYALRSPVTGAFLFTGNDFQASPLHDAEGLESALDVLRFLTLQKGDTDDGYFAGYTAEQLAWTQSADCEELSSQIYEHEAGR